MYNLAQIANLTNGTLKGDGKTVFSSIVTDSRKVKPHTLFVAIKGEKYDGHDFVKEAMKKGAIGSVVESDPGVEPAVVVVDSVKALGQIARDYVVKFKVKKIGITGTNGKTTTKNLIGSILKRVGPTCIAVKSYNNAIGIPLTIFELRVEHRYLVLEYGTNHPGEIGYLVDIVRPDIGVLTNVGPGHLEGFGSVDAIRREKITLLKAVDSGGFAIFPENINPEGVIAQKMTFGVEQGDIQASNIVFNEDGSRFRTGDKEYKLRILGPGNINNSLAAIAVAKILEIDEDIITEGLYECKPVDGRLVLKKKDGIIIIDDSYNANPVSVREAASVMAEIPAQRKIIVLGDMLELGTDSEKIHRDTGELLQGKVDLVISYGRLAKNFLVGFGDGKHFDNKENLVGWLKGNIKTGDLVLVKGSRKMAMEEIVSRLEG